jgi:hypothetical protein
VTMKDKVGASDQTTIDGFIKAWETQCEKIDTISRRAPEPHNEADAGQKSSIEIFYSYSHHDAALRDELEKHLSLLRRQGFISNWHDRSVCASREWEGEINSHLNEARIILLLVSTDFMASDYIYDVELKRAMERHEKGEASVVPIILRPCDWQGAPFSKLQALPKYAQPVTTWPNHDEAFLDIARGIRLLIEHLNKTNA